MIAIVLMILIAGGVNAGEIGVPNPAHGGMLTVSILHWSGVVGDRTVGLVSAKGESVRFNLVGIPDTKYGDAIRRVADGLMFGSQVIVVCDATANPREGIVYVKLTEKGVYDESWISLQLMLAIEQKHRALWTTEMERRGLSLFDFDVQSEFSKAGIGQGKSPPPPPSK